MMSRNDAKVFGAEAALTLHERDYDALVAQARERGHRETACFADTGYWPHQDGIELFLRELIPIPALELSESATAVGVSAPFSVQMTERLRTSRTGGLGFIHSHPNGPSRLSPSDETFAREAAADLARFRDRGTFMSLVCSPESRELGGRVFWWESDNGLRSAELGRVRVVGSSRLQLLTGEQNETDFEFLKRQWSLFGDAQRAISQARLCFAGLGSNSHFAIGAAQAGFRRFVLIDPDVVELHNLNRFRGAGVDDVGSPKVDVVRREILRLCPSATVIAIQDRFENAMDDVVRADIVLGGVDNAEARLGLNRVCALTMKPYMDLSGGGEVAEGELQAFGFQVTFYRPGSTGCFICANPHVLRDFVSSTRLEVMEATGYVAGVPESPPQVVTLSLQGCGKALEMLLFYLAGTRAELPVRLLYDALDHSIAQFTVTSDPECGICGEESIEGLGHVGSGDWMDERLDVALPLCEGAAGD